MLSIKTNLSNLNAQSNLKLSNTKLNQAVERLSSGYKLNHASDNAANYSISTNMSTKLGAYKVAEENTLQGLEMMTTTADMLSQIEDKLLRMRTLAVQAQNGTYGTQSLNSLSAEADSLLSEINRINESATYNGIKLFNTDRDDSVTNTGKELKLNEQGFLQNVVKRDTSTMVSVESINETQTLAVGTYSVSSVEDLLKLHNMSKAGLLKAGSEFVLANDIDLKEYCKAEEANGGWTPIKLSSATLDGNGYTIFNLYINRPSSSYQAFLANESVSAVKNLKLENVDITADSNVGAFVSGYVGNGVGSYVNCSATGKIVAKKYVGAIVGAGYYSNVTSCYADMDITGTDYVGGLYGYANYSDCLSGYFKGSVTGNNNVGGIVGFGFNTISNCKVVAAIRGNSSVGGICSNRPVSNSYFSGSIIANNKVGGISGTGRVNNCIIEGSVYGVTNVGIFSGGTSVTVKNGYYYGKNLVDMSITADDSLSTISNIVDITIPCDYVFQIGTESDSSTSLIEYTTYIEFSELKNLLSQGISDKSSIDKIDGLLDVISLKQTELGSVQNRLESVLEEIGVKYDNLISSRSTIRDADVAEVSSTYIKQQILQNAGATLMSASQNVNADMVLGLLQGLNR